MGGGPRGNIFINLIGPFLNERSSFPNKSILSNVRKPKDTHIVSH
jgi:hypothetical protein